MHTFSAVLNIIGINPFVFVPDRILQKVFKLAGKHKGPVPVSGTINGLPYKQTLVKYKGAWRLYINTTMLKQSPKRIGETLKLSIGFDPESRAIAPHAELLKALRENKEAKKVFNSLTASASGEIVRYISRLKTAEAREKNIKKAIQFLLGKERFAGRSLRKGEGV